MQWLLVAVPPIIFALAIIQVRGPIIKYTPFETALQEHNDQLVETLMQQPYNVSQLLNEELTRMRLALQGKQDGEQLQMKLVMHIALGIGDSSLPPRLEWIPSLLLTNLCTNVCMVCFVVWLMRWLNRTMSDNGCRSDEYDFISPEMDVILKRRKANNPHQPPSMNIPLRGLHSTITLASKAAEVQKPLTPSLLPFLALLVMIIAMAAVVEICQGGGMAVTMFGMLRRTATLSKMEPMTSMLDHVMLVLGVLTTAFFYLTLARFTATFNSIFYALFDEGYKETPLLLTSDVYD